MKGGDAGLRWFWRPAVVRPVFWLLLVFVSAMAWLPVENPALTETHPDKVNHVAAFAVLTVFLRLAYGFALVRIGAVMLVYGMLIEAVQLVLPYRYSSPADVAAYAAGILLGISLIMVVKKCSSE